MPVVIASQAHADTLAAASSITIAKPVGTVAGDLLLSVVYASNIGLVNTPPSGWTAGTSGAGTYIAYKVAGASEPADYTFTSNTTTSHIGSIVRVTGAHATAPVTASGSRAVNDGASSTMVLPSVSAANGDAIIQFAVSNLNSTWTSPAGTTKDYETAFGSGRVGFGGQDNAASSGGATGTRTWTSSASVTTAGGIFAIKPASTAGPNVQSWTTQLVAGGVIAVAKPVGVVEGDFLFVHCEGNTFPATWTPPSSDWFQLVTASTGATFVKFATASEPASWTFTSDQAGSSISARATRVSNVGSFGMGDFAVSRGTRTPTVFASKSAKPGALYLQDALLYPNPDIPTWTPPADTVEHEDAQYGFLGSTQITAGTETGSKTWTPTSPSSTQGAYSSAVLYGPTAAPVVRSWTAKNNDPSTTSTVVPVPAGTVAGDLLIASYYTANTNLTITPPAGWTTIPKVGGNGGFWKIATGSEGATQTFSWTSTLQNIFFQMVRVTGHSATNPIQASAFNPNAAASNEAVLPSLTVANTNSTLLQLLVVDNSNTGVVWTNPATTQELWDTYRTDSGQPRNATYAGGVESVATGATGTRTWSINGNTGLGGLALVLNPFVEVPPVSSNVQRAATLYLKNTPTVDTGTGIDVRHLSATQDATNDVTQSVRFTHTQDNVERTFDPANALVATVADASTLQKVGWGLRVTEEMTPTDDTNCNVMLTAGTLTVPVDVRLNMNGAANGGSTTTQTFRASLWRYNPTTDAGTLIASGSQTQAWNTVSLGGDNNTFKTVTVSIAIPTAVEFAQGETLLLQVGVQSGTLSNPLTGTTNFDITLRIDNATSRIVFAANQGLRVVCSYTLSAVGEGLASRVLNAGIPRTALGEGLASSAKASTVSKVFTILGEGLASVSRVITLARAATGKGTPSMSRAVAAARTVNVAGEGLVSKNTAVAMSRDAVGEGLASGTKVTTASKTFDVAGEGLVSMTRTVLAVRSFTAVGEGAATRGALVISVDRNPVGEGLTSFARATVVSKSFTIPGEGLVTRGPLLITQTDNVVGEGQITEAHPVQAFRTFNLVGDGEILMTGPNGSTITLPLNELPTSEGGGGPAPIIKKNTIYIFD